MIKILFIFGTRPEAIKMAPLIIKAKRDNRFSVRICVTGQHREMILHVLNLFKIVPDYDLDIMRADQSLFAVTSQIIFGLEKVLRIEDPSLVFVQGDTTTAFAGALAAFYNKTAIAHIEAGLRSGKKYSPFPEEINRVLVGDLADYHFAPTLRAQHNLLHEGKPDSRVYVVGNTVIDALKLTLETIKNKDSVYASFFNYVDFTKKLVLVTGHRRESFGDPFKNICLAIKEIARTEEAEIIYPVHLNPNVRKPVFDILHGQANIHLIEPLEYDQLIWLMSKSYFVLTDSGGIQEEAPTLGKPVLVMRDVTERTEGVDAGCCKLVGSSNVAIEAMARQLFHDEKLYRRMATAQNPYGDGTASEQILDIVANMD